MNDIKCNSVNFTNQIQNYVKEKSGNLRNFVMLISNNKLNKMEDKKFQFKTNINCDSCVSKVTPFLNDVEGVCHWEVDTKNKDKVLTVASKGISEQEVIETIQKAGFKIEPITA